jgi:hypothetical protein
VPVTLELLRTRTRSFEIPLSQLLSAAERTFDASGRSAACGTSCQIDAQGRPLIPGDRKALPQGVSTGPTSLGTLRL